MLKNIFRPVKTVALVLTITLILLEVVLRVYNPMPFSVSGGRVNLRSNGHLVVHNALNPKLESTITITSNNIGLRGGNPPGPESDVTRLICVGGSTTMCYYNSDSLTWPYLLGERLGADFWVNNAGLNGHSSYGHQILLEDYLLELNPDVILFLIGINDMSAAEANQFDTYTNVKINPLTEWLNKSEVIGLVKNLVRAWHAQTAGVSHSTDFDLTTWPHAEVDTNLTAAALLKHQQHWLPGYRSRIGALIDTCLAHQIQPVFMTQPVLFGQGFDPITGVNLGSVQTRYDNGYTRWQLLQQYNQSLKEVCQNRGVGCIDLANQLPKNSTYYYDFIHYTTAGNRQIVELVAPSLTTLITPK